jgi:hypothetical protein
VVLGGSTVNDVVRPKTVEGRKDLQSFSKHSRTPITRVTMRPSTNSSESSAYPPRRNTFSEAITMKILMHFLAGPQRVLKQQLYAAY